MWLNPCTRHSCFSRRAGTLCNCHTPDSLSKSSITTNHFYTELQFIRLLHFHIRFAMSFTLYFPSRPSYPLHITSVEQLDCLAVTRGNNFEYTSSPTIPSLHVQKITESGSFRELHAFYSCCQKGLPTRRRKLSGTKTSFRRLLSRKCTGNP